MGNVEHESQAGSSTAGKHLTPTERLYELAMAHASRRPMPPEHAAEVKRNAKGDYEFIVTVRGGDIAETVEQAIAAADALEAKYPRVNGGGDK